MQPLISGRSLLQMVLVTLALLVLPLGAISIVALYGAERYLLPELSRKAESVGQSVADSVRRALDYGIPLDALVGMDEFLDPMVAGERDLSYIALADRDGRILYASGLPAAAIQRLLDAPAAAGGAETSLVTRLARLVEPLARRLAPVAAAVTETPARRLGHYFDTVVEVEHDDEVVARLHVGVDEAFIGKQLEEILFDIAIVLMVGLLIAFELLVLVLSTNLSAPLTLARRLMQDVRQGRFTRIAAVDTSATEVGRFIAALNGAIERVNQRYRQLSEQALASARRAGQTAVDAVTGPLARRYTFVETAKPLVATESSLVVVRLLAFLFVFAEELARPFLPVYIARLAPRTIDLQPELMIGLPISTFLFVAALSMAFGGLWSDRVGRRRSFVAGALLATLGLIGTALAPDYLSLLLARAVSGGGYGLAFVSCQGYVVDRTSAATNRASGVSIFVGGIMAADICGPAIGGILADRIGFEATLLVGAGAAALAAVLVYRLMEPGVPPALADSSRRGPTVAGFWDALRNWRFMTLVLLAAVPAKMLLTGFLFYQVPLFLTQLGSSQSEIGRIAMCYGIAALLLTPLFATLADRWRAHAVMVGAGGMVAGAGMLPILFEQDVGRVLLAVVLLGVGQAMSISALLAIATRVGWVGDTRDRQAAILGVFRLLERIGAALGPFMAAGFVTHFGFAGAMAATGLVGVTSAVLFSSIMLFAGWQPEPKFVDSLPSVDERAEA